MNIIKHYVTKNMHYKKNRIIPVRRLVLHSVGVNQPKPEVFLKQWDSSSCKYLTQLLIGANEVYETLPCMETKGKAMFCYHVGDANSTSIGAEMTEPSTIKYSGGANFTDLNPSKTKEHVLATYKNAVDVFAQLCKFHGLNPLADGVILSHRECNARGIGTNHADVEHLWSKFGLTMAQFRKDVANAMGGVTAPTVEAGTFRVTVSRSDLNMRTGPAVSYDRIKYIPKGVYTIVETRGDWGRLKSQQLYKGSYVDAWINLNYTTRV